MKTYRGIPFTDVDINGGFWQARQQLNRDVTIEAVMNRFMETGRFEAELTSGDQLRITTDAGSVLLHLRSGEGGL